MNVPEAVRLLDYLRGRQGEMVSLLRRLVLAESPSHDPSTMTAVFEQLAEPLIAAGYGVRLRKGRRSGGQLIARPEHRPAGSPLQLLLGHADTVWPTGTLTTMPVREREGRLYGPGVYDMKGGLVQGVFALQALRTLKLSPTVLPVFFVNSDEEIGSRDSRSHILRLARLAERVLVLEPSLGPSGKLKTERKGGGSLVIRVLGRAAHAGLDPERGASAILELTHVVQRLFALNEPEKGITVNVGSIDGGLRPNVIAPEAKALVDVRVLSPDDATRIERSIREMTPVTRGTRIVVEGALKRPPMRKTAASQELWRRARRASEELAISLEEGTAGGSSDGNTTCSVSPTLDGLGAVGDGAHARDEHVLIDALPERAALLARLLLEPPLEPHSRTEAAAVGARPVRSLEEGTRPGG